MKKSIYFFKTLFLAVLFSSGLSLMAQAPEIELQQPTGGETWTGGGTYLISWLDNFNGNVDALYKHVYDNPCDNFEQTAVKYELEVPATSDLIGDLQGELGSEYTMMDWNDLTVMNSTELTEWLTCFSIGSSSSFWVSYEGNEFKDGTDTHYYIKNSTDPLGAPYINLTGTTLYLGTTSYFGGRYILAKHIDSDYNRITSANGTSGATCYWNTNNLVLGKYQVKVRSHNVPNNTAYADSSGFFTLVDQEDGEIKVLEPNGNESWAIGSTHVISWIDNLNEPVDIYLLDESVNPTTEYLVDEGIEGTTYEWYIDDNDFFAGTSYKIEVRSSVYGALTPPDASNNNFTITLGSGDNIKILQPNKTNIKWARNTEHLISWNDDLEEAVNVYYKKVGGTEELIEDNVEGTTLIWDIDIAEGDVGTYTIIVRSTLDPLVEKPSKTFEVTLSEGGTIKVLQPNKNNIKWAKETSHLISWNDNLTENVDVYYMQLPGNIPADLVEIDTDVEGTTLVWDIPDLEAGDYQIFVRSTLDPSIISPVTTKKFAITASAGNDVTIIQPSVNGIQWQNGTDHLISWTDDFDENVTIELWNADKTAKVADIEDDVWGSTTTWTINNPEIVVGDYYTIKVYSPLDSTYLYDFSNKPFKIVGVTGDYIHIFQPNGGEDWVQSMSYYVSWEQDFIGAVNVELYKWDGAAYVHESDIDMGVNGSTTVWTITEDLGSEYQVRVSAVDDQSVEDFSNNNFSIIPYVMLNAYPNPASNMFTVEVGDGTGQQFQVTMHDRFNTEVYSTTINSGGINQVNISTQDLPNGVYFLNVSSNTYNASRKIIVNHR